MWRTATDDVDWANVDKAQIADLRTLFTSWSQETSALHSYASRQAADITQNVYLPRWKAWIDSLLLKSNLRGTNEYTSIETKWVDSSIDYLQAASKTFQTQILLTEAKGILRQTEEQEDML